MPLRLSSIVLLLQNYSVVSLKPRKRKGHDQMQMINLFHGLRFPNSSGELKGFRSFWALREFGLVTFCDLLKRRELVSLTLPARVDRDELSIILSSNYDSEDTIPILIRGRRYNWVRPTRSKFLPLYYWSITSNFYRENPNLVGQVSLL